MKRVFVAGATRYLGRYICAAYQRRGWYVIALARKPAAAAPIAADQLVAAEATAAATLNGVMAGVDLVISCLGITGQQDGLSYWDVDYQANINLLREAERAGVTRFAYIHAPHAKAMARVPMVAAKSAFVKDLLHAHIAAAVIVPIGHLADTADVLKMARSGRVWPFGDGTALMNPMDGAALAESIAAQVDWLDRGGPCHLKDDFSTLRAPDRTARVYDINSKRKTL